MSVDDYHQFNTCGIDEGLKAHYKRKRSSLLARAERLLTQVLSFGNLETNNLLLVERSPIVSFVNQCEMGDLLEHHEIRQR